MKVTDVVDAYLTRQRSLGMRFEGAGRMLHRFSRVTGNPTSTRSRRRQLLSSFMETETPAQHGC
jgi:hypothetical protein